MIVFEVRNSYELLVSFIFGKYLMARDSERVAILQLNLQDSLNYSATAGCGIIFESIKAQHLKLIWRIVSAIFTNKAFKSENIQRLFLFHEISPLSLSFFFGKEVNIVEHGEINYRNVIEAYTKFSPRHPYALIKRLSGHAFIGEGRFFSYVYLKDPGAAPAPLREKVRQLDIVTYYDSMTSADKQALFDLFLFTPTKTATTSMARIIITQPFSELGLMTEARKIEMYRSILPADGSEAYIKPHPKETTDYGRIFPGATILDQKSPFELLWLAGLRNSVVYTVNSSVGRMPGMNVVHLGDSFLDEFKN